MEHDTVVQPGLPGHPKAFQGSLDVCGHHLEVVGEWVKGVEH